MKNIKLLSFIWLIGLVLLTVSCVEQIDIKTLTFEDALVVEGTITSEYKFHEIKLSRTYKLEEKDSAFERKAIISIIDDIGNTYSFEEDTPGVYISDIEFRAIPEREYQLKISTSNGSTYSSTPTKLTSEATIESVYALKSEDDDGVSIYVDSFNPNGNTRYYRFEYEETYKIIAPKWKPKDLVIVSKNPPVFDFTARDENKRNCYKTIYSKGIIQTETNNLVDDRITEFPIRFIAKDNYIISHRYSMLLKQYVQSQEAYTFYKILNDLSSSESLFSQNQPGFVGGNIFSENNSNEKVIGFFEVSSVSTKRMFFSPKDLDLIVPYPRPYPVPCHIIAPQINPKYGLSLFEYIESGRFLFYVKSDPGTPPTDQPSGGPFILTESACGDCTSLGSNVVPEFWQE